MAIFLQRDAAGHRHRVRGQDRLGELDFGGPYLGVVVTQPGLQRADGVGRLTGL
jgi:hypothetical protein